MIGTRTNLVDPTFDTAFEAATPAEMALGDGARHATAAWWILPVVALGKVGWGVIGLAVAGALP